LRQRPGERQEFGGGDCVGLEFELMDRQFRCAGFQSAEVERDLDVPLAAGEFPDLAAKPGAKARFEALADFFQALAHGVVFDEGEVERTGPGSFPFLARGEPAAAGSGSFDGEEFASRHLAQAQGDAVACERFVFGVVVGVVHTHRGMVTRRGEQRVRPQTGEVAAADAELEFGFEWS